MRLDAEDEQESSEAANPNVNSAPAVQPPSESRHPETTEGESSVAAENDVRNE
jgi:hypothetical protein